VHARKTRGKERSDPILTARPSADYVKPLECEISGAKLLYDRLSALTHPSNSSIDWLYELNRDGRLMLSASTDGKRIAGLCKEFPGSLDGALMMSCNPALLVIRVLHEFGVHPRIPPLRQYDFGTSALGRELKRLLRR
jgi:hypothetical protein